MPDLATHALISFAGIRTYEIVHRKKLFSRATRYLIVLGGIYPDLLSKTIPYTISYFYPYDHPYSNSLSFLHTPLMLLITIYIFCFLFDASWRKMSFWALSIGVSSHLILDLCQGNICDLGYMWLFPISMERPMIINLFYDDSTTPLVPFFLFVVILIEIVYRKTRKQYD